MFLNGAMNECGTTTLSEQGKKTSRVQTMIQCQSKAETVVRSEWFYENDPVHLYITVETARPN